MLNKVEAEAKSIGAKLIHLDTFDFQAKDFYLKYGYKIFGVLNNCPPGHERYYMKKTLDSYEDKVVQRKIARTGVYGVATENGKMLAVRQQRGPFVGKLDFPGGGIEFGESPEQALRREFVEEVAMEFDSLQLIDNLTDTVDVQGNSFREPYSFYQIGMIYRLDGCRLLNNQERGDLEHLWVDLNVLSEGDCSKLLWKYRMTQ